MVLHAIAELVLAGLVVWFAGALLLRLAAISCFIVAAGLLAAGGESLSSPVRAAVYGAACWLVGELLYRARRGRWRPTRAARLLSRRRLTA